MKLFAPGARAVPMLHEPAPGSRDALGALRRARGTGQPENTVATSVYRASDRTQVATNDDTHGVALLAGSNEAFTEDLLVSVSGPPEVLYELQAEPVQRRVRLGRRVLSAPARTRACAC
jgi:hypothetical protein